MRWGKIRERERKRCLSLQLSKIVTMDLWILRSSELSYELQWAAGTVLYWELASACFKCYPETALQLTGF